MGGGNDEVVGGKEKEEEEQDGMSVHSPCKALPSSASSLSKEQSQVELELTLLEALEIYPPLKLRGIHRHFVLYGLMEYLGRSFDQQFTADEVLQLLDRFYNIEMLKSDDEDIDILNHEEDFTLPQSYFDKEEQEKKKKKKKKWSWLLFSRLFLYMVGFRFVPSSFPIVCDAVSI